MTAYTYDDLRHLPDGWDGEPGSAIPSEPSIALLQALEPHVRAVGLEPSIGPDASGGCGFWVEGGVNAAWIHVTDSGSCLITCTGDGFLDGTHRLDLASPLPDLSRLAKWVKIPTPGQRGAADARQDHTAGAAPRLCPYPYGPDWSEWTAAYAEARAAMVAL